MKKIIIIFIVFLFSLSLFGVIERNVRVDAISNKLIQVLDERIVTLRFRITNNKYKKITFNSKTKLPENWRLLTTDEKFDVAAKGSDIRIVSFYVPENMPTGKYDVTYLAEAERYKYLNVSDFETIYIEILPKTEIKILPNILPEFVIAGKEYSASFIILNNSNQENKISVKMDSWNEFTCFYDRKPFILKAGESKILNVKIQTDHKIKQKLNHRLDIIAKTENYETNYLSSVKIIPLVSGKTDIWKRLPSVVTFKSIRRQYTNDDPTYRMQAYASGEMNFDAAKKHNFIYRYVGRNYFNTEDDDDSEERDNVFFQRFFAKYWTDNYQVKIGDTGYKTTSLLGSYYGRGAEINGRYKYFNAGIWNNYEINDFSQKRIAFYSNFNYKHLELNANWLNKNLSNSFSLQGKYTYLFNSLDFEFASNPNFAKAYLMQLKSNHKWFSYSVKYLDSPSNFRGNETYHDRKHFFSNLILPIWQNTKLNTEYEMQKDNNALDTTYVFAPFEQEIKISVDYDLTYKNKFSIGFIVRNKYDMFTERQFDYYQENIYLSIAQYFKNFSIFGSAEFGRNENKLNNISDNVSQVGKYTASASFSPTKNQIYSANMYYFTKNYFSEIENNYDKIDNLVVLLTGSFVIEENTSLDLSIKRRPTHNTYGLTWQHHLPNFTKIALTTDYTAYQDQNKDDFSVSAEISVPLRVPIYRKQHIGSVKGRVIQNMNRLPLQNVMVNLNGYSAVSDQNGVFKFSAVKPGSYNLTVNTSETDHSLKLAQEKSVTVVGGKNNWLELPLSEVSSINGRIALYKHKNDNLMENSDELEEVDGFSGVIIEMEGPDGEKTRTISNGNGHFNFFNLYDGKWSLKLYNYNLPKQHYFERDSFDIEISANEKKELHLRILPKKRELELIEDGGTIIEEND
ncbi:MAG: carboxypeptidase regulatory-like domain-containing protein [Candidatus Cloacimonetes bacterium]|jgi:hypothetical protein|nr:carboxypeptidase regulatory-like domain-containing protein [Candidatus Cloacimonadota bacterium]MBT6994375.1 carboxypeptidase regulatory-like domain-containing protein [Candidatus Cloacimonadota bacterium]